jgi:acetolactate synthase small subunit
VILVQPNSLVIRLVDDQQKIADFLGLMKPYRVLEVNRSGLIAMVAD